MESTVNFTKIFDRLLEEFEKPEYTHPLYDHYAELFERYLVNSECTTTGGHFYDCIRTVTGDVVDTCNCRHYFLRYPYELLKQFLYEHHARTNRRAETIDVLLTYILKRARILAKDQPLYDRWVHILERHLVVLTGRGTEPHCVKVGCQCYYLAHTLSYNLLKLFLLDDYLYSLELRTAECTPWIPNDLVYNSDEE